MDDQQKEHGSNLLYATWRCLCLWLCLNQPGNYFSKFYEKESGVTQTVSLRPQANSLRYKRIMIANDFNSGDLEKFYEDLKKRVEQLGRFL